MATTHLCITGQTQSGKTLLARQLARSARSRGGDVIVYDPTAPQDGPNAAGWDANYVTACFPTYLSVFWRSRGCLAIMDEAADVFEAYRNEGRQMLRRGRHINPETGGGGHVVALIAQRYTNLDKTAREQCNNLFAFNQSPSDGELLAKEWNCPDLEGVSRLPKLHYIALEKMGEPRAGLVSLPKN